MATARTVTGAATADRRSVRTTAAALLVAAALLGGCQRAAQPPDEAQPMAVTEADLAPLRQAAATLGANLQAELQAALRAGGPVAAIDVCQVRAPQIAAAAAAEYEVEVGRTALRLRNPANAPDAWEREGLAWFADQLAAGADAATLERYEVMNTAGTPTLRWMKPIMLGGVCATCHGEAVDPDLLAEIRARYPQDEAVGFAPGSLRGAFTAARPLAAGG